MPPDARLLHEEAAHQIQHALLSYEGDPTHVAIYALRRAMEWNDLQVALSELSREGHDVPACPERIAAICKTVDAHLEDSLRDYLEG